MTLGEVCLLTDDVKKLSHFYKLLLNIDSNSSDETHQTLIKEETMFTIYNDGSTKKHINQSICLAFSCNSVDKEYNKLLEIGVEIVEEPQIRPWGTKNMSFRDPDGNLIYLREFINDERR